MLVEMTYCTQIQKLFMEGKHDNENKYKLINRKFEVLTHLYCHKKKKKILLAP